jgi:hypothetical protein
MNDIEIISNIAKLVTKLSSYPKTKDWHTFSFNISNDHDNEEFKVSNTCLVVSNEKFKHAL